MNRPDCIRLIHNTISAVLCTTEEFNLKDSENLLNVLIQIGVVTFEGIHLTDEIKRDVLS